MEEAARQHGRDAFVLGASYIFRATVDASRKQKS
jgi:hypothetical protein